MVTQESINVYRNLHRKGIINQQQFDIISHLLKLGNPKITARELEVSIGWRPSTLVARINELLNKDYSGEDRYVKDSEGIKRDNVLFNPNDTILIESAKRECKISGNKVRVILVNIEKQIGFL